MHYSTLVWLFYTYCITSGYKYCCHILLQIKNKNRKIKKFMNNFTFVWEPCTLNYNYKPKNERFVVTYKPSIYKLSCKLLGVSRTWYQVLGWWSKPDQSWSACSESGFLLGYRPRIFPAEKKNYIQQFRQKLWIVF